MPNDPRDYRVEISGMAPSEGPEQSTSRPFLSVHFACCSVYCRVYRNPEGTAYAGRCPKCGRAVTFLVGAGGTDRRSFVVE